jgi:hypothetical protein
MGHIGDDDNAAGRRLGVVSRRQWVGRHALDQSALDRAHRLMSLSVA